MECDRIQGISDAEYGEDFGRKALAQRVPISGGIALTHRCNLRCVHCYLGDQTKLWRERKSELSTAQWRALIDEFTAAGCLFLLITGGEPLLRQDFAEVYGHARRNGLVLTVFTNGTLIADRHLRLFEDLPPHAVEITLYGATAETYEKITGIHGSFERCMVGIRKLLSSGIRLTLKTVLMTLNQSEFYQMQRIADDLGVKFYCDAAIFPKVNGDTLPLELRVNAEQAVAMEFSQEETYRQWFNFYQRRREVSISDTLYMCGAGMGMFHIDASGRLAPCIMIKDVTCDIASGGFGAAWNEVMPGIRKKLVPSDFTCRGCDKVVLCGYCPSFFLLENGDATKPSGYLCALGQGRLQAILKDRKEEQNGFAKGQGTPESL
jgi:radical SAM protein with 4Fe4S-binding SPASM domain